ncbi:hypothetical protein R6Z07F_013842 [Ovis aries]
MCCRAGEGLKSNRRSFPGGSVVKNPPANAEDTGGKRGLGSRPRGEGEARDGGGAGAAAGGRGGAGPGLGAAPELKQRPAPRQSPAAPSPCGGQRSRWPGRAGSSSSAASACGLLRVRVGEAAARSAGAFAESGRRTGRDGPSGSLRPHRGAAEPPPGLEAAGPGAPRRDGGPPQAQLQGARASGFLCPQAAWSGHYSSGHAPGRRVRLRRRRGGAQPLPQEKRCEGWRRPGAARAYSRPRALRPRLRARGTQRACATASAPVISVPPPDSGSFCERARGRAVVSVPCGADLSSR